jgi:hypothetical protein
MTKASDEELVQRMHGAARDLSDAVRQGVDAGLEVRVETFEIRIVGRHPWTRIAVRASRPILGDLDVKPLTRHSFD